MIDGQGGLRVFSSMYVSARRDFEALMAAHAAEEGACLARRVWQDLLGGRRRKSNRFERKCKKVLLAAIIMAAGIDELNLTMDELVGLLIGQRGMVFEPFGGGRAMSREEEFFVKVNEFIVRPARFFA